mmetsp:Transcript_10995/g.17951  ORF Transcript_10995/g.17951 Transcript_10995/m.17951 type:complete len:281 (+) Transcript_10995:623-1465(+)
MRVELLLEQVGISGRVEGEESGTEAGREGGLRLGHATLGAGHLGGVTGEEVVHGLARRQARHRGEHAIRVTGQEEDRRGVAALRVLLVVINMVDGVGHAAILRLLHVEEVHLLGLGVHMHVLQQRVAADGAVDVWLRFLGQVDCLGIAASFEVEDAVVIPAMLVVADKLSVGVGGERGLASTREAEVQRRVALLADVGGAVHRHDALQRQPVMHHGEDALLHLAAIEGASDERLGLLQVEGHEHLAVETVLLPVLIGDVAAVNDGKVGLEVLDLLGVLGA